MTQPGQERGSVAATVARKPKARKSRAKSPKPAEKANRRHTVPSAKARARASAPAAPAAKATAVKAPEEADGRGAAVNGQIDRAALEEILEALIAARDGDFTHRLSRRRRGIIGEIASAYNELVGVNGRMEKELGRIRRVIGREGRMDQRASLGPAGGSWETSIDSINDLVDDLVRPTTEV